MGVQRMHGWTIICFEWRTLFGLIESLVDLLSIPRLPLVLTFSSPTRLALDPAASSE